jgi:hypothetical protein
VAGCRHRREMAAQKGEAGDVLTQGEKTNWVKQKQKHHLQKRYGTIPQCSSDPEGQKLPTKIKKVNKFNFLTCWIFSFEG